MSKQAYLSFTVWFNIHGKFAFKGSVCPVREIPTSNTGTHVLLHRIDTLTWPLSHLSVIQFLKHKEKEAESYTRKLLADPLIEREP